MNNYTQLARKAIESYVKFGKIISSDPNLKVPRPGPFTTPVLARRAGCFVSIHKKNGDLRGCIGTILPTCKNLAAEIISNAIAACQDSRFLPLGPNELNDIEISVDVLSEPKLISSPKELDVKKYGLIVQSQDGRQGLLLPDIEGVETEMDQISFAREKANIAADEPIFLYRFEVKRYKEH